MNKCRRDRSRCSGHSPCERCYNTKKGGCTYGDKPSPRPACDICAMRKVKCDKQSPCSQCVSKKLQCQYKDQNDGHTDEGEAPSVAYYKICDRCSERRKSDCNGGSPCQVCIRCKVPMEFKRTPKRGYENFGVKYSNPPIHAGGWLASQSGMETFGGGGEGGSRAGMGGAKPPPLTGSEPGGRIERRGYRQPTRSSAEVRKPGDTPGWIAIRHDGGLYILIGLFVPRG